MLKRIAIIALSIPVTMAHWSFSHMFHSVSHEVSHDVNSDTKAVDKSVSKPIASTGSSVVKNTDRGIAETSENMSKGINTSGKDSMNFIGFHSASHEVSHDVNSDTKAVDESVDNAPKAISSTGNNVAKNTDRGIAETSENMSKGINTSGKDSMNFIEHPLPPTPKAFMTQDGGDETVAYAGNQDSQDPEAGTNTVKWGDSSQGKATMRKDAMSAATCAEQVGLSAVPVAGQLADVNTVVQDSTQKNYAEESPCANIVLATDAIS